MADQISYILATKPVHRTSLSIRVMPDGSINVNAPRGISRRKVDQFISSRLAWINKRQNEYDKLYNFAPVSKVTDRLSVRVRPGSQLKIYQKNPNEITIIKPHTTSNWQAYILARPHIKQSLNDFATKYLPERTSLLAKQYNLQYQNLSIRYLRSRWGSCTSTGNISLNSQLMRLSNDLIDYVITHELAHLTAPNHSAQFHQNLTELLPNARSLQRQLRAFRLFY